MRCKNSILIAISAVFLCACGNDSKTNQGSDEVVVEDTPVDSLNNVVLNEPPAQINPTLKAILDKTPIINKAPMVVDTNFVNGIETENELGERELSYQEGRFLTVDFVGNTPTNNAQFILDNFCRIDSLKTVGGYDDYVATIDIGMIQYVAASSEVLLELTDLQQLVLWQVTYSTYEACPYASGTLVLGSLIVDNQVKNTTLLAEVSGGGDPPVWSETRVFSTIKPTSISTVQIDRFGEYDESADEDMVEESVNEFTADITENGIVSNGDF